MEGQQEAPQLNPADTANLPRIAIIVEKESLSFFTTILQSGIEMITEANITLGRFLCSCPGFSEQYLAETVQTIFLNGTALDDLQTPLNAPHPVVALSAAMPGLAGAILRKNSLHSALRTATSLDRTKHSATGPLAVTLKLFNRIARDKGELLLSRGVVIASPPLVVFFSKRPETVARIHSATLNGHAVLPEELTAAIALSPYVQLVISGYKE